jgi:hypothetical protein
MEGRNRFRNSFRIWCIGLIDIQDHKDLIVLTSCKNSEHAIKGILSRQESLGIRNLTYDIHINVKRDPGCLLISHHILRLYLNSYSYALVLFDHEGCGKEKKVSRETLELRVETLLSKNGWDTRAAAIVIDPELDIWVWSDSPHVDKILGWRGRQPDLRTWLAQQGFLPILNAKPKRPKEAMEAVLKLTHKARSSSIYKNLAEVVGLQHCNDPAFIKLKTTLRNWFPLDY